MKRIHIYLIFGFFLLLLNSPFSMASEIIPNQYIVVFKDQQLAGRAKVTIAQSGESVSSVAERLIDEATQNQRLSQKKSGVRPSVANELGDVYEYALKGFSAQLTPEAAAHISRQPEVDYVVPDQTVEAQSVQVDPPSWNLDRIDQEDYPLDQRYEYRTYGAIVHAYVVDSGIRASHNEFIGRIGNGRDTRNNDNNPNDCYGHGTHVAGVLGGTTYGVAKNVVIHPVRVIDCQGAGSSSHMVAGINWIIGHLQLPAVVNISLSSDIDGPIDTAVNNLINAGATVVVAAGQRSEANNDACNKSPARVENVITVASTLHNDAASGPTNIGPCVDIFAPGALIESAWYTGDTAAASIGGTSLAAPHVAGVAALYLQRNPAATAAEVTNAIIANSTVGLVTNIDEDTPNRFLYSLLTPPPEGWLVPAIATMPF